MVPFIDITTQREDALKLSFHTQYEDRRDRRSEGLGGMEDSNISAMRIENLELRRKIDDLETLKTELQQKHLKEVCNCK